MKIRNYFQSHESIRQGIGLIEKELPRTTKTAYSKEKNEPRKSQIQLSGFTLEILYYFINYLNRLRAIWRRARRQVKNSWAVPSDT